MKSIAIIFLFILIFSFGCFENRQPNPELCDKVSQQDKKDSCFSRTAFTLNNPDLCNKIIGLNKKDDCYTDLAVGMDFFFD